MAQLSIATTLSAVMQITRKEKKKGVILRNIARWSPVILLWYYAKLTSVVIGLLACWFRFFWLCFWYCLTMSTLVETLPSCEERWMMDVSFIANPTHTKKNETVRRQKHKNKHSTVWVPFFVFFHFYPLKWGDTGPSVYCTVRIFRFSILWCQFIFSIVEVGISLVANINLECYLDLVDMLHIMCVFG